MARTLIKNIKYLSFIWISLLITSKSANAQNIPEIPSSVSFGGITVKFDRSAQNLIEEDVKSLISNKKFWEEKMDRAILHFPIVEAILMDEEVPIDFKYLAVQESSFRPDVVSTSNAVGYWQFKPETARELNLRVDGDVDERKNISSSTHAAAWYLKKNNQQFNNWVTTLYSYYQGAGGVKKIVPASWAYAREVTLTSKTDRYMLRFFAHKIALEAGIERYKSSNALVLMESDFGKGKSLDEVASALGISSADLKNYNKWLTDDKIPNDREYLVTLPVPISQVASVREKLSLPATQTAVASVYEDTGYPVLKKSGNQSKDPGAPQRYEINGLPGIEAVAGYKPKALANSRGLRMPKFMRYNDMVADMALVPGKVYYLAKKHKKASTPFHTARPGDTWHSVSQQYGVRLVSLLKFNRTTSRNYPIQTGQVLFLTKKRPKKQPIEIIAPPQPKVAPKDSDIAVAPEKSSTAVAAASTNAIPDKPSGRKKYTPVLVEKTDSGAKESEPVTATSVPAVTATTTVPTTVPSSPAKTPGNTTTAVTKPETDDRVVIITQDNANDSFKSSEDERPVAKANGSSKVITPNDTRTTASTSVYARQRAAAAERAAREAATENPTTEKPTVHTVESGDTFFGIASKYNLTLSQLLDLNNRNVRKGLIKGEKLIVSRDSKVEPVQSVQVEQKAAPEKVAVTRAEPTETFRTPEEIKEETRQTANPNSEFHVVQGGQTYYSISKAYNLSIKELLEINNLDDSDRLKSGQRLRVRQADGQNASSENVERSVSGSQTHTVAPGETLFRIAQTYHKNIDDIKKLNNMSGNNVMVGQKIKIPQ
ncbi:LysM peptidoglycan-binding domain-containing protein [Dyadobacter sp. CY323]|uniref:LysM peptidoglycan-binding domain-containing protein n=1 Tax=Dyadobacter sp. CY323 TaxID=2907302 RepID=UPI001F1B962A|nr:LysM peptidoglycan-binding domain-containing protein [Dyadobacter sp. CY323]MCE6990404.1 LysM peptidoglycan-binding domain-containing protein [Dyadobacter sp. CY323]